MKALNTYFIIITSIVLFSSTLTVKAEKTDSIKIDKRIDSVYKITNDSVFAFSTVFDAIKQSKEIGFKAGEVSAMHLLGYMYIEYGYLDSAKKYLLQSHELTKEIKNEKVIAQNYRLLAIYYESTDNFDKALDLLFRSLIIRKRIKDEKGENATYISIGVIYQRLNLDSKAIIYYNKALKYFERLQNEAAITSIYSNLGAIYNGIGKIDSAIIYLEKVIEFKSKIGDKISLAKAYHNIGASYSYLGKYNKAIIYFNKAIELKEIMKCIAGEFNTELQYKLNDFTFGKIKSGDGMPPEKEESKYYNPCVVVINLGTDIEMIFVDTKTKRQFPIMLPRRSMFLFQDKQFKYQRSIAKRFVDKHENQEYKRSDRYSLVFKSRK
jgi:tetratricopeptide (TPR) repeat protein